MQLRKLLAGIARSFFFCRKNYNRKYQFLTYMFNLRFSPSPFLIIKAVLFSLDSLYPITLIPCKKGLMLKERFK